jgi:hypothetical protein
MIRQIVLLALLKAIELNMCLLTLRLHTISKKRTDSSCSGEALTMRLATE